MSTIINNNTITKMYKGDTPIYSFSINSGGDTPTKIDVAATGIKFGFSTFTEIPDIYDFSNVTDMSSMFYFCSIQSISMFDTSKVTNMSNMFGSCYELHSILSLDTSNVTSMSNMFNNCYKLTTISMFDTSNVTNMYSMFYQCKLLQSIPLLDCGNVTNMNNFFGNSISTLTDLGGFKNLKISITSNFLEKAPNLTVESLMNVINNLYDLTANGLSEQSLKFGQTNLDKLSSEQIAAATAKGWTLLA